MKKIISLFCSMLLLSYSLSAMFFCKKNQQNLTKLDKALFNKIQQVELLKENYSEKRLIIKEIEKLLKKGANPNATKGGSTPLIMAIEIHSLDITQHLIRYNADVNLTLPHDPQTPLHHAISSRQSIIVHTLILARAELDIKGPLTPLEHAVETDLNIANLLLRYKAPVTPMVIDTLAQNLVKQKKYNNPKDIINRTEQLLATAQQRFEQE